MKLGIKRNYGNHSSQTAVFADRYDRRAGAGSPGSGEKNVYHITSRILRDIFHRSLSCPECWS